MGWPGGGRRPGEFDEGFDRSSAWRRRGGRGRGLPDGIARAMAAADGDVAATRPGLRVPDRHQTHVEKAGVCVDQLVWVWRRQRVLVVSALVVMNQVCSSLSGRSA